MSGLLNDISQSAHGIARGLAAAGKQAAATVGHAAAESAPARGFAEVINHAKHEEAARRKDAEDAAAGLVSNALILPILKQLRRSSFGENTAFSPGIGEKAFGPEFDMQLADRIAHSPSLGIKNALAKRMLKTRPANKGSALNLHG
jgi:Rod binding domain-containing protein